MLLLLLTHLPHNLIMISLLINKLFLCQIISNTGPRWKLWLCPWGRAREHLKWLLSTLKGWGQRRISFLWLATCKWRNLSHCRSFHLFHLAVMAHYIRFLLFWESNFWGIICGLGRFQRLILIYDVLPGTLLHEVIPVVIWHLAIFKVCITSNRCSINLSNRTRRLIKLVHPHYRWLLHIHFLE